MKQNIQKAIKQSIPSVLAGILCLVIAMGIMMFPKSKKNLSSSVLSEYSSVSAICELATLKSFYHNVALYEVEPDATTKALNDILFFPFNGLTKTGSKKLWQEYSGIVEMGIDAGQVQINNPDAKGVVDVFVPDAKVLNVNADRNSFSEPITETGLFTSISGEDQAKAFSAAQNAMRQEAEEDHALLRRAKNNAMLLLKQYIINTGKEMGVVYSVNWIDSPI